VASYIFKLIRVVGPHREECDFPTLNALKRKLAEFKKRDEPVPEPVKKSRKK